MSGTWETILEDLERHVAEVLAAAHGDEDAITAVLEQPQSWLPPTVEVIPDHLVARAQALAHAYGDAQAMLQERLSSLRPQRDITRRLTASAQAPSVYLDIQA